MQVHQFLQEHWILVAAGAGGIGWGVGWGLRRWAHRMSVDFRRELEIAEPSPLGSGWWAQALTAVLFAGYVAAVMGGGMHASHEVRPDLIWSYGRMLGHLFLIALLVASTAIDWADLIIPDQITFLGMAAGVGLATLSGDVQLMHLWVDWNHPLVNLHGQWIPDWIREHRHWHGLAWSLAGLAAGGGLTWLCRITSSLILRQESLGFGDVTLMAMIGSFLGWQPIVFVFLLAPICGLVVGVSVKAFTNRSYVPYGPYLSLAAVLVLLVWKRLWELEIPNVLSIRKLFGDPIGLGMLTGIAVAAFFVLLGLLRLSRMIPGRVEEVIPPSASPAPNSENERN